MSGDLMTALQLSMGARYVVDRDGDLWRSTGPAGVAWECLTTPSAPCLGADLVNVCGPLIELGQGQTNVLEATDAGAVWSGKTIKAAAIKVER